MNSQKMQEIIISTIEEIAKNTILNTNFLTLINGQISHVDKFDNYYNFTYQKEEYTGFSITGEKYEVGDLVYVLKLNNDLTSKQMIISKVNSYTNFDIELAINDSLEEIKESINKTEALEKEINIIGNTVFTLNDDLTITPEELTFSAQKSATITDIIWYVDGKQQVQDELKKIVISNSMVKNKDSLLIRVEDANNAEIYDEITVIRAMSSDTKLEFDLGLDSILLQKNEQGIIDYSKAILIPRILSDGEDITSDGWEFNYKIESGNITLVKEQNNYRILEMTTDKGKISFFAIKDGNMYLQKIIYLTVVAFGEYNLNISVSNQNFIISQTSNDIIKDNTLSTTIRASRGNRILKIHPKQEIPPIGNVAGTVSENSDNSLTYSWELNNQTILNDINGNIKLLYEIENEEYSTDILWTTVNDGPSAEYRLDINPPNVIKNGDNTFTPNLITINSIFRQKDTDSAYNGYFKIYKTTDNEIYATEYESKNLENEISYKVVDENVKAIKIELFNDEKKFILTDYCYITTNSNDFVETTSKTEKNITDILKIEGQITTLVEKDTTLETTINNLETDTEQKFAEVSKQYTQINQKVDSVTTTVSEHTEEIESINGEIVNQENRLTQAEEKLTAKQWSLWFTEVVNNSTATSTKFTMDKKGLHIKGGGIDIINNSGTKVLYADTNGNLTLNGSIQAISGKIGGFTINSNGMSKVTNDFAVYLRAPTELGESGNPNADVLVLHNRTNNTYPIVISSSGKAVFTDVKMSGNITATSGKIGGMVINGKLLQYSARGYVTPYEGKKEYGTTTIVFNAGGSAGNNIFDFKFVTDEGLLYSDGYLAPDYFYCQNLKGLGGVIDALNVPIYLYAKSARIDSLTQGSLEGLKDEIELLEVDALNEIINTDVYKYKLKFENTEFSENVPTHLGFIIGDNYKLTKYILGSYSDGIDLYSAIALSYKAIQELYKKIEEIGR